MPVVVAGPLLCLLQTLPVPSALAQVLLPCFHHQCLFCAPFAVGELVIVPFAIAIQLLSLGCLLRQEGASWLRSSSVS